MIVDHQFFRWSADIVIWVHISKCLHYWMQLMDFCNHFYSVGNDFSWYDGNFQTAIPDILLVLATRPVMLGWPTKVYAEICLLLLESCIFIARAITTIACFLLMKIIFHSNWNPSTMQVWGLSNLVFYTRLFIMICQFNVPSLKDKINFHT